ncbi:MAG: hypothetical protein A3B68_10035 [Candidatus Melainabacteria bacterium RIFCSPHIGHO2_02_FULL_34_12]|nr:MAG: hypothetical protein A3B68_10035 [Candidatus Melainabacteria bacterium RIFCSPHIGHO2_02_FULL_34_12]
MGKYNIAFKPTAEKELNLIPIKFAEQIINKIRLLTHNSRPMGVKKLKNNTSYRIRVGVYRVIYEIDDRNKIVTVYKIRHRKDIYR